MRCVTSFVRLCHNIDMKRFQYLNRCILTFSSQILDEMTSLSFHCGIQKIFSAKSILKIRKLVFEEKRFPVWKISDFSKTLFERLWSHPLSRVLDKTVSKNTNLSARLFSNQILIWTEAKIFIEKIENIENAAHGISFTQEFGWKMPRWEIYIL
jgi:hypothetical protein